MNPSWSFGQLRSRGPVSTPDARSDVRQPQQPVTHSIGAIVHSPTVCYPRRHLLGLPPEIRIILWQLITHSIRGGSAQTFWQSPRDEFSGLLLTCRQAYAEVQDSWYRYATPWPQLQKLLETRFNPTTIKACRSLSIELRLDAHRGYFTGLAAVLSKAQPYLTELRLYLIGNDLYGHRVHNFGCGTLEEQSHVSHLEIGGQRILDLLPLWKRIAALARLEVLVISNPNMQIFDSMVLAKKPYLKYICLRTDSRSVAHKYHNPSDLGFLLTHIPEASSYPPVKALHIAKNASLSSNSLAAKVAETLEHLTWVVPDARLHANTVHHRHGAHRETAELLNVLRAKSTCLQSLRVCLGGAAINENAWHGTVLGSFKANLPHLQRLRTLEVHLKSESPWFGKEIVARLPNTLENLYITDRCLLTSHLLHQVWERYLAAVSKCGRDRGFADVTFIDARPSNPCKPRQAEGCRKRLILAEDHGPWLMNTDCYSTYHPIQVGNIQGSHTSGRLSLYRNKSEHDQITQPGYYDDPCYINAYRETGVSDQLIGEMHGRRDYIPFHTGQLSFVHFEYDAQEVDNTDENIPSTLFTLLLIDGRLLDKKRNRHLAKYDQGQHISPNCTALSIYAGESATRSENLAYSMMLHQLYATETERPRNITDFCEEVSEVPESLSNVYYFGNEADAVVIFEREHVARPEDMPEYRYPVEEAVVVDGKCHWMSPEAVVDRSV